MLRLIAIDWSGARAGARSKIWIAEARDGELVRLECGRDRDEVVAWLIAERARGGSGVVGLDFSFSLPAWYLDDRGHRDAPSLWAAMARDGEALLAACAPPFWGRPGRANPRHGRAELRRTEEALGTIGGVRPKSTFQIGGAGAVGTGSLRGMPALHRLASAGFAVWPFTPPAAWTLVEIYPRALTGAVIKSDRAARAAYLSRYRLAPRLRALATASEDAFDAAVSALVMAEHADELSTLPREADSTSEGVIWVPGPRRTAAARAASRR